MVIHWKSAAQDWVQLILDFPVLAFSMLWITQSVDVPLADPGKLALIFLYPSGSCDSV